MHSYTVSETLSLRINTAPEVLSSEIADHTIIFKSTNKNPKRPFSDFTIIQQRSFYDQHKVFYLCSRVFPCNLHWDNLCKLCV